MFQSQSIGQPTIYDCKMCFLDPNAFSFQLNDKFSKLDFHSVRGDANIVGAYFYGDFGSIFSYMTEPDSYLYVRDAVYLVSLLGHEQFYIETAFE